jgi:hypothetical protein
MKKRIYIDTCVIGGYFDAEFRISTALFFENILAGKIIGVISEITQFELKGSPKRVQEFFAGIPNNKIEFLELIPEASLLEIRSPKEVIGNER